MRDRLEELLDLRGARDEGVEPELVPGVLDQLDEGDQKTPRMRSMNDKTYVCSNFFSNVRLFFGKP